MSTSPQQPTYIIPAPAPANWKTPLLIGVLVLLAASNIFLYVQMEHARTEGRTEISKLSQDFNNSLEKMRLDSSEEVQRSTKRVQSLQSQLAASRRAASQEVGQAKIDAERRVESLQEKVAQEQAAQQQAITQVKQTADSATTQIASVSTDVGSVKTDVANTKTQLDQTVANLKRATGELDEHSSLIATNGKELQALKDLGERNYMEFTILKSKTPTKLGSVSIELRRADQKRNRFTIEVIANDKTVEKKDRTVNEPIQFYAGARQPDEIVVNSVGKDKIVGYLAIPKVQTPRGGS